MKSVVPESIKTVETGIGKAEARETIGAESVNRVSHSIAPAKFERATFEQTELEAAQPILHPSGSGQHRKSACQETARESAARKAETETVETTEQPCKNSRKTGAGLERFLCPVDEAARIVGQKWTLQIVHHLLDGRSRRFCELQDALGKVNPSTLSSRLKMLEEAGLVSRSQISDIPPHVEYRLTEMGAELRGVINEITRWSNAHLCTPQTGPSKIGTTPTGTSQNGNTSLNVKSSIRLPQTS